MACDSANTLGQSYAPFGGSHKEVMYSGSSVTPLEIRRGNVAQLCHPHTLAKFTGLAQLHTC
jgi:hypothetical protein